MQQMYGNLERFPLQWCSARVGNQQFFTFPDTAYETGIFTYLHLYHED